MPNLAERIQKNGTSQFMSWRWAFFLPGCMHIGSALAILAFGQVSTAEAAANCCASARCFTRDTA